MVVFRNILFAPITEEIVFRSLMMPLLFSYYSKLYVDHSTNNGHINTLHLSVMITCPLYFGIAHVHHLIESIRSGNSIIRSIIVSFIQFMYTSIFGSIAVVLLLRSGNIISPIVSHIYCNVQGLPDLGFMEKPGQSYRSNSLSVLYPYRYLLFVCHGLGLIIFMWFLYPLTSSLVMYSMYNRPIVLY